MSMTLEKADVQIRKGYDPSVPYRVEFPFPTLAKQSFAKDCDINNIMARYAKSGLVDHVAAYGGDYADMPSNGEDLQSALNLVMYADGLFLSLPAEIRSRFLNDPVQYLAFCSDPENEPEMREMGLLPRAVPAAKELDPTPGVTAPPETAPEVP